jgi:hypothetical protein
MKAFEVSESSFVILIKFRTAKIINGIANTPKKLNIANNFRALSVVVKRYPHI